MKWMVRAVALLALVGSGLASAGDAKDKDKDKKAPPASVAATVAVVDGAPITAEELDRLIGSRLFALRNQEYDLKRQVLEEAIVQRLMEKEAKARNVTLDALVKAEIDDKLTAVTPEEVKAFYESNKARMGSMTEADASPKIEAYLREQRNGKRRGEFAREVRSKASVQVLLEPPRTTVGLGPYPVKGPATAPVTLVMFSDYQCPYCSRIEPTLKQLQDKYGDKLRMAFRDFPLVDIHKDASRAAEAAACANEQGKFWEMHDKMFANQGALGADGLKKTAGEIGLAVDKFGECLESGRFTPRWKEETADGASHGVTGTPAFFINGRFLNGARPLEEFTRIIDDELERPPATVAKVR